MSVRRILKWAGLGLGAVVALLAACFALALIWLRSGDPVADSRKSVPPYVLVEGETAIIEKEGKRRLYRDLRLEAPNRPPVRFTLSVPEDAGNRRMPVLVIVGGLKSGRENLERLPPLGPNALISFEYPYRDVVRNKKNGPLTRLGGVRQSAAATPEQIAAVLRWSGGERWADGQRVALLGYSLGAVLAPAVIAKADANAIMHGVTILAFGGADIGPMVPRVLKLNSAVLAWPLAKLAGAFFHPIEPAHFLAGMTGEKLVINAEQDELIPKNSQRLMTEGVPEPKWIVSMPGDHIDPRDPKVLAAVVDVTKRWLVERGAVDLPD